MFVKDCSYTCSTDIIVNKHLWFKKDLIYQSPADGMLVGCDHYTHTEEDLKEAIQYFSLASNTEDKVNHPSHYTWLKEKCGIEVIDITRHMDFDLGNACKYILRAGHKSESGYTEKEKMIEDLKKAVFYIEDKIKMLNENPIKE